jgi:hypothetical protein
MARKKAEGTKAPPADKDKDAGGGSKAQAETGATKKVTVHKTITTQDHKVYFPGEVEVSHHEAERIHKAHQKPELHREDTGEEPEEGAKGKK